MVVVKLFPAQYGGRLRPIPLLDASVVYMHLRSKYLVLISARVEDTLCLVVALHGMLFAWITVTHHRRFIMEPVLDWVTEVYVSLDHDFGTVYPALCDSLTWTLDSSNDFAFV